MATETEHLHYIEHRHEAGYGIKTTFTCKGDRTSPCHQYPPRDLEIETWGDKDKHLFVSHDKCLWVDWAEGSECHILCGPDDDPVRGGPEPVQVWFEDCMFWEYMTPNEGADGSER